MRALAREGSSMRVSLHVVTLLPRGRRKDAPTRRACPSINVNQPLNNDAPCKEDFIVLRREQSWRHNAAPSFFRAAFSAAKLPPNTLESARICSFLHAPSFFFFLCWTRTYKHKGCAFRKCFYPNDDGCTRDCIHESLEA